MHNNNNIINNQNKTPANPTTSNDANTKGNFNNNTPNTTSQSRTKPRRTNNNEPHIETKHNYPKAGPDKAVPQDGNHSTDLRTRTTTTTNNPHVGGSSRSCI